VLRRCRNEAYKRIEDVNLCAHCGDWALIGSPQFHVTASPRRFPSSCPMPSTDPQQEFEQWAKSLEEANAGIDPATGKPLVSPTEWKRLEEVAEHRKPQGLAGRMLSSVFGKRR
jgi:hypothetical protein